MWRNFTVHTREQTEVLFGSMQGHAWICMDPFERNRVENGRCNAFNIYSINIPQDIRSSKLIYYIFPTSQQIPSRYIIS